MPTNFNTPRKRNASGHLQKNRHPELKKIDAFFEQWWEKNAPLLKPYEGSRARPIGLALKEWWDREGPYFEISEPAPPPPPPPRSKTKSKKVDGLKVGDRRVAGGVQ